MIGSSETLEVYRSHPVNLASMSLVPRYNAVSERCENLSESSWTSSPVRMGYSAPMLVPQVPRHMSPPPPPVDMAVCNDLWTMTSSVVPGSLNDDGLLPTLNSCSSQPDDEVSANTCSLQDLTTSLPDQGHLRSSISTSLPHIPVWNDACWNSKRTSPTQYPQASKLSTPSTMGKMSRSAMLTSLQDLPSDGGRISLPFQQPSSKKGTKDALPNLQISNVLCSPQTTPPVSFPVDADTFARWTCLETSGRCRTRERITVSTTRRPAPSPQSPSRGVCRVHGSSDTIRTGPYFQCQACTRILSAFFSWNIYPNIVEKSHLLAQVGMDKVQLENWFTNRRRELKNKLQAQVPVVGHSGCFRTHEKTG
ncbi:uncharacterized protein LOC135823000 [Sycon ciliatum]|uniref:uncharacterized protein LOC135823000 n=1 Tax=Sycon ciliatum TaxID=27933 RepID=UPI0031F6BC89|eukprot:scpid60176/ scgid18586/ 